MTEKPKQVQISKSLFLKLVKYHLGGLDHLQEEISQELQEKLDKQIQRNYFTAYKTAPTEEEREEARQKYLDLIGVPSSFRTEREQRRM